jgi:pilus assembly protein CpaF
MLTAMTTGHEGSLSTLHASSPADAIRRVQTLALMGDLDLPYRAVAEQVASALDLIVHQARLPDGARRVVEVASVAAGPDGARLTTLVSWAPGEGFRRDAPAAEWLARARSAADLAAAA